MAAERSGQRLIRKVVDGGTIVRRTGSTASELSNRQRCLELFRRAPIPKDELLGQLGLFINRQVWSRYFYLHELYRQIIGVHGVVMEFGVRWGQNLALFTSLRGMYEPFNHTRKIIGFDTFEGFPSLHEKDGRAAVAVKGAYGVTEGYERYLEELLAYHESESPISHMRKFELVKGDVCVTVPAYLERHPETIIALAYFDLDLYEPTKACLEALRGRLTKGSIVAFDELNYPTWPGETLALKECLGLDRYAIRRTPHNPEPGYIVIE
jgi:hypothetical protein